MALDYGSSRDPFAERDRLQALLNDCSPDRPIEEQIGLQDLFSIERMREFGLSKVKVDPQTRRQLIVAAKQERLPLESAISSGLTPDGRQFVDHSPFAREHDFPAVERRLADNPRGVARGAGACPRRDCTTWSCHTA